METEKVQVEETEKVQVEEAEKVQVEEAEIVTTGEWIWSLLIMALPVIGLIMLFYWGFSAKTKKSKSNWAKASLIFILIYIGAIFLFGMTFAMLSHPNM